MTLCLHPSERQSAYMGEQTLPCGRKIASRARRGRKHLLNPAHLQHQPCISRHKVPLPCARRGAAGQIMADSGARSNVTFKVLQDFPTQKRVLPCLAPKAELKPVSTLALWPTHTGAVSRGKNRAMHPLFFVSFRSTHSRGYGTVVVALCAWRRFWVARTDHSHHAVN